MTDKETLKNHFIEYENRLIDIAWNNRLYGHEERKKLLEKARNSFIDALVDIQKELKDD